MREPSAARLMPELRLGEQRGPGPSKEDLYRFKSLSSPDRSNQGTFNQFQRGLKGPHVRHRNHLLVPLLRSQKDCHRNNECSFKEI